MPTTMHNGSQEQKNPVDVIGNSVAVVPTATGEIPEMGLAGAESASGENNAHDSIWQNCFRPLSDAEQEQLGDEFAETGRVVIPNFLNCRAAVSIADALERHDSWWAVQSDPGNAFEFAFENYAPQSDKAGHADGELNQLAQNIGGEHFVELVAQLAGLHGKFVVSFQATRYSQGHFISEHTDDPAGYRRKVAYVLNLSRGWRPDWGGLLLFPDEGYLLEGLTPFFNNLVLFRVPRRHFVTPVMPHAKSKRYSISGWLHEADS